MYPRICDQNQCMGKFCLSVISDSLSTTGLHKYGELVYLTWYVGSIALQLMQWRKQNPIVKGSCIKFSSFTISYSHTHNHMAPSLMAICSNWWILLDGNSMLLWLCRDVCRGEGGGGTLVFPRVNLLPPWILAILLRGNDTWNQKKNVTHL